MVALTSLWLPVVLSAVFVFVASSVIHMLLGYHAADYGAVPEEADVQAALRRFTLSPGDYVLPCPGSQKDAQSASFKEKQQVGPNAFITVLPNGGASMGKSLAQWFVFTLLVSLIAAYVASLALPVGAGYRQVFRLVSTVAFASYALGLFELSIWFSRSWGTTARGVLDGLIYALLTAGTFGWLWPK